MATADGAAILPGNETTNLFLSPRPRRSLCRRRYLNRREHRGCAVVLSFQLEQPANVEQSQQLILERLQQ
jgi:hypothetical protein